MWVAPTLSSDQDNGQVEFMDVIFGKTFVANHDDVWKLYIMRYNDFGYF